MARRLAFLSLCCLCLVAVLLAGHRPATTEEDRSSRVMTVLGGLLHSRPVLHWSANDFLLTKIERRQVAEAETRLYVPVLPPGCGMTMTRPPQRADVVRLATLLFEAHGHGIVPDHALTFQGRETRLSGYAPETRTGFHVVDREAPPIPRRVLVLPLSAYTGLQNDDLTPLFAAALSIVDFLNGATGGADVDITPFGKPSRHQVPLPSPSRNTFPTEPSVPAAEGGTLFVVASGEGEFAWEVDPGDVVPKGRKEAPGLVVLPLHFTPPLVAGRYDPNGPRPRFRLEQKAGDAVTRVASDRPVFLTPAAFDPRRAFTLVVEGPAGQYHVGREVTLTTTP